MEKKARRIKLALTLTLVSAMLTTTCLAATWYAWGPQFFTPYTGSVGAFSTYFSASELKWTSEQISDIIADWPVGWETLEIECRPYSNNAGQDTTSVSPSLLWDYQGTDHPDIMTNLPDGYGEFQSDDPDDIAIVCGRLGEVEAEEEYYGEFELEPKNGITFTNRRVLFESEYGVFFADIAYEDSLPLKYEQLFNRTSDSDVVDANTYFGRYYEW